MFKFAVISADASEAVGAPLEALADILGQVKGGAVSFYDCFVVSLL